MTAQLHADNLRATLRQLGERLARRGVQVGLVIVGGAALNLTAVVNRRTADVDVIALGTPRPDGPPTTLQVPAALPLDVLEEAERLARDLGLPPAWLNVTVAETGHFILPPGFAQRITWERLDGLWLGIAGRWDLIALKLHAAAVQDRRSRHFADLVALHPTPAELESAGQWIRTRDPSPAFAEVLRQVIADAAQQTR